MTEVAGSPSVLIEIWTGVLERVLSGGAMSDVVGSKGERELRNVRLEAGLRTVILFVVATVHSKSIVGLEWREGGFGV